MISSDLHLPVLPTILKFGTEIGRCLYENKRQDSQFSYQQLLSKIQSCELCQCHSGDCIRNHNNGTCNPFPHEIEILQVDDLDIHQLYVIMHALRHSEFPGSAVNDEEESLLKTLYTVDQKKGSRTISKNDIEDLIRSLVTIACPRFSHRLKAQSWELIEPENHLDENDKRWLATGLCLNTVVAPLLRCYVEPAMLKFYTKLQNKIGQQSYYKHEVTYNGFMLQYKLINDNCKWNKQEIKYDYSVINEVDLSKLFVYPHEAGYKSFGECDTSALMSIIYNIDEFDPKVRTIIGNLRAMSRNKWAHYKKRDWSEEMYINSLTMMKDLVSLLDLSSDEAVDGKKQTTIKRIDDWKHKYLSVQVIGGKAVNLNLRMMTQGGDNEMKAHCHGFNGTQETNAIKNLSNPENKKVGSINIDDASKGSLKLDLTAEKEIFKDPDTFRTAVFKLIERMIESAEVDPDELDGLDIDFVLPNLSGDERNVVEKAFPGSLRGYVDDTSELLDGELSSVEPEQKEIVVKTIDKADDNQIQTCSSLIAGENYTEVEQGNASSAEASTLPPCTSEFSEMDSDLTDSNIVQEDQDFTDRHKDKVLTSTRCKECSRKDERIKELESIIKTHDRTVAWLEEDNFSELSLWDSDYETMSIGTATSDITESGVIEDKSHGLEDSAIRCFKMFVVVSNIFPKILQSIMKAYGLKPAEIYQLVIRKCSRIFTFSEQRKLEQLLLHGYDEINMILMFKILRNIFHEHYPMKHGLAYSSDPNFTIRDDLEKLRLFRNKLFHRTSTVMSKQEYDSLYVALKAIFDRIDNCLACYQDERYTPMLEQILNDTMHFFKSKEDILAPTLTPTSAISNPSNDTLSEDVMDKTEREQSNQ